VEMGPASPNIPSLLLSPLLQPNREECCTSNN
jgi:hypothetical protein